MTKSHDLDTLRKLPKVLLHDHLDGGLRPETVIELARADGIDLPTDDPDELATWFFRGANRGNLTEYLEGFGVTISVMQTQETLRRIAFESIEDLHRDGVVYAEIRFAPLFHTEKGLNLEQVVSAVLSGLEEARERYGTQFGLIICGMRSMDPAVSLKMAELAVAFRNKGCVAFDLAGDEYGHPPKDHLDAFHYCKRESFGITIHAGEAFGISSIWQALQYCGAHRIGHCTRLIEDIQMREGEVTKMGPLAHYVRDHRIPLEVCLYSNVHTGATPSMTEHPFRHYFSEGFRVTLNTDNRLMSRTTMSEEFLVAQETFGLAASDFEKLTVNAMKSAFIHFDKRLEIIYDAIKPGYAALRDEGVIS